jgi:hypothetical protein
MEEQEKEKKNQLCFWSWIFLSFHQIFVILLTCQHIQRGICHIAKLMQHNRFFTDKSNEVPKSMNLNCTDQNG